MGSGGKKFSKSPLEEGCVWTWQKAAKSPQKQAFRAL